ncbi:hypothetical protein ONZ45_g5405 [Pleurotus djamor]|nr:hypothetical protein ONZ45_g5405 [Pleurotus djamor]
MVVLAILTLFSAYLLVSAAPSGKRDILERRAFVPGIWSLVQQGTTGVSAQQLVVVSETKAIIFDKVENNPLKVNGHAAWSAEIDLGSKTVRALNPASNTWCATGSFIGNGTFISTGGNPMQGAGSNGLQGLRQFNPCNDASCDIIENPQRIRLTSRRWYPSSVRLEDGSMMIYGGSVNGGFQNNAGMNNPTYEFYPPKNTNGFNGLQIPSQFLRDTLNGNHFPNLHYLPDGRIFISANQQAMIFNWKTNTETRLPNIPNGVRISSPYSAGAILLPLTIANNFTPEIMICGGSTVSDQVNPSTLSSQTPASSQCARLVLTTAGIAAGWKVEQMPEARIFVELVQLPDGRVLLVNGARTGVAGYGNVGDQIGASNADHPTLTAVVYDPSAAPGSRFSSSGIPASTIARMYHSTSSLLPDGSILLAGSNPNDNVNTAVPFPTEYRMEFLSPPYMSRTRPTYTGLPATIHFGASFVLNVNLPANTTSVTVNIIDLGFATHGVHMDQRLVQLQATLSSDRRTLRVTAPANGAIFPPGPGYLYIVTNDGVPSVGKKAIIGTGASPPVDVAAISNMLSRTSGPSLQTIASTVPKVGEGSHVLVTEIEA